MYKLLLDKILEYKNISIFRHKRPDGDCVFSAYALKEFILTNFKDKKVKCLGKETYDVFPFTDEASDDFVKNSLAIIVDVSNDGRIDDERYKTAKEIIIIDHHPSGELPSNVTKLYKDEATAADCELIARILFSKEFKQYEMSYECCKYLLSGIITDSNCFSTSSTTHKTLSIASKLIKKANLSLSDINYEVFSKDYELFIRTNRLMEYLKIKGRIAYIILDNEDLQMINLTANEAKNNVDALAKLKDIDIWGIFVYNSKTNSYDGSVRSRKGYAINTLANKYNGGGHKSASGVKNLSIGQVHELIDELKNIKKVY